MAAAVVSLVSGALVLGAGAPAGAGTFPGKEGLIAFVRSGDIYVTAPDGTNPLGSGPLIENGDRPAWSPNGRKLAFLRTVDGEVEVFVARADGSDEKQVTPDDEMNASEPTWIGNGRLVYSHRDVDRDTDSATDNHFMMIRDSGSDAPSVYRSPTPDVPNSLGTPEGTAAGALAFGESYEVETEGTGRTFYGGIWVAAGQGPARMVSTYGVVASDPTWHPSGGAIAYVRRVVQSQCCAENIYVTELGGGPRPLLKRTLVADAYDLSFSPTGQRLVYSGYFENDDMYLVDVRSGKETYLGWGTNPDWQPRPGSKQNFVMGAEVWAQNPQRPKVKPNRLVVKAVAGAAEKVRVVMAGKVVAGGKKYPLRPSRSDVTAGRLDPFASKVKRKQHRKQVVRAVKRYRKAVAALEASPSDPALQAAVEDAVVRAKLTVRLTDSAGLTVVRSRTVQLV